MNAEEPILQEQAVSSRFAVPQAELDKQKEYTAMVETVLQSRFPDKKPLAFVHTYGCQGNVADGEKIKGIKTIVEDCNATLRTKG